MNTIHPDMGHLQNIGCFFCGTGLLEICDPSINDTISDSVSFDTSNQANLYLRNCATGLYDIYYEFDQYGDPIGILLSSCIISYQDLSMLLPDFTFYGNTITSFSHILCVIESCFKNNACFSFFEIEPEAEYNSTDLKNELKNSPYNETTVNSIRKFLQKCISEHRNVLGKELFDLIPEDEPYWNGFKSPAVRSSHWAVDSMSRVHNDSIPFAAIVHGFICLTNHYDICSVSILRNRNNLITAVRIYFLDNDSKISFV